ncbi:MAG: MBL fold metallo-hydrolase [Lachnospiraceae bacterium]|nr:MBL fold metallo-hydrolase [Lachnospiraceae bacterium]
MKKGNLQVAVVGTMQTNCYLLTNTETKETVIVDPGDQGERIASFCLREELRPVGILLTHGHFDHIGGVHAITEAFRTPVYASAEEEALLAEPGMNLSAKFQGYSLALVPDVLLEDGEVFTLGGFAIKAIHTPGHTGGGMCYYLPEEGIVFSGDTLFRHTYGRTDLPTSSFQELKDSLLNKVFALPEETEALPGHGNATTIAEECKRNPIWGD